MNIYRIIMIAALITITGCAATSPSIEMGADARVNAEGLHFVNDTAMDEVWFRPGAGMTGYKKLMVVNAGFLSDQKQTRELQKRHETFQEIVIEEFTAELRNLQGLEFTDAPGSDVLLLHAAVTNIELVEESSGAGSRIFVNELGRADLVIDLRDSVTGESILMAKDFGVLEEPGRQLTEATDVATWAATRRMVGSWARQLRAGLEVLVGYQLGNNS